MYTIFTENKDGSFFALKDNVNPNLYLENILRCDCIVSDVDGTDFMALSKSIVRSHALSIDGLHPQFLNWARVGLFTPKSKRDGNWHWERWHEYMGTFLATEEQREKRTRNILTPDKLREHMMPGLERLYSFTSTAHKVYFTGNIQEVAQEVSELMGFNGYQAELYNKYAAMEELIASHPYTKFFVKGNGPEDQAIADAGLLAVSKGKIEYCINAHMVPRREMIEKHKSDAVCGPHSWEGLTTAIRMYKAGHRFDHKDYK